ncbi:MAG: hypothetical protein HHJ14_10400 [Cellulomonas sp.]|nr:hypothetical protein [Cellulomonas sp.]
MTGQQDSGSWDSNADRWQAILNELEVPPRSAQKDAQPPVSVQAQIRWARDGAETIDTVVNAWTSRAVLVEIVDARRRIHGAWLAAADVRRRDPTA